MMLTHLRYLRSFRKLVYLKSFNVNHILFHNLNMVINCCKYLQLYSSIYLQLYSSF